MQVTTPRDHIAFFIKKAAVESAQENHDLALRYADAALNLARALAIMEGNVAAWL